MTPQDDRTDVATGDANGLRPRRGKLLWWTIGGVIVLIAIVVFAHWRAAGQPAPTGGRFGGAPLTVGVARVTKGDVPITINALGTVTPLATVTVHPQITGPLVKIAFTEGQSVKAGDLLVQIDPRPYQAALDQAAGQLKRDQALMANAKVDMERYKTLLAQNSVSDQTYATQVATVAQDEGAVASDQAALEAAKLNLSYCRITSPVPGLVGLRQVDLGNLMQANTTEIVVVTQMQPMSVLFTVPEDSLSAILQRLRAGQKLQVDAYDRSLTNKIASGVLANADHHRHIEAASPVRQQQIRAFPQSVRQRHIAVGHGARRHRGTGRGHAAGRLWQLRLCGRRRQHGEDAIGDHRSVQRRPDFSQTRTAARRDRRGRWRRSVARWCPCRVAGSRRILGRTRCRRRSGTRPTPSSGGRCRWQFEWRKFQWRPALQAARG